MCRKIIVTVLQLGFFYQRAQHHIPFFLFLKLRPRNEKQRGRRSEKKKCKGKHGATKIFAKASRRVAGKPVLLFWESGRHSKSSGNDYGLRVHEGVCMRSPKHTSTNMLLRAEEKRRKKKCVCTIQMLLLLLIL